MEPTESMKEELLLHQWRTMRLDRSRLLLWGGEVYKLPNDISVRVLHISRRPIKIEADLEHERHIESILEGMEYSKKVKTQKVKFSVRFTNKGEYLDLLWELYSI